MASAKKVFIYTREKVSAKTKTTRNDLWRPTPSDCCSELRDGCDVNLRMIYFLLKPKSCVYKSRVQNSKIRQILLARLLSLEGLA